MSERPSISQEVAELLEAMPGPFAPAGVLAAWFRRKAALQWRIAAEADDPVVAQEARRQAELAERHAVEVEAE